MPVHRPTDRGYGRECLNDPCLHTAKFLLSQYNGMYRVFCGTEAGSATNEKGALSGIKVLDLSRSVNEYRCGFYVFNLNFIYIHKSCRRRVASLPS